MKSAVIGMKIVANPFVSTVAAPLRPPVRSMVLTPETVKGTEVPGLTPVVYKLKVATEPSLTEEPDATKL
jgi:hypothetical protein